MEGKLAAIAVVAREGVTAGAYGADGPGVRDVLLNVFVVGVGDAPVDVVTFRGEDLVQGLGELGVEEGKVWAGCEDLSEDEKGELGLFR